MNIGYKGYVRIIKNGNVISRHSNSGQINLYEILNELFTKGSGETLSGAKPSFITVKDGAESVPLLSDVLIEKVDTVITTNSNQQDSKLEITCVATVYPSLLNTEYSYSSGFAKLYLYSGQGENKKLLAITTSDTLIGEIADLGINEDVQIIWKLVFSETNRESEVIDDE